MLEHWFILHKDHPYASTQDIFELHRQTKLNLITIRRWLDNHRFKCQSNRYESLHPTKYRHLTIDERRHLCNYFDEKTKYPDRIEIKRLASTLGFTETRIRNWFENQRSKENN
jgi:hypothetical protein